MCATNVRILYDFGVDKGGGDYVMVNILQCLCEARFHVILHTSNPRGLDDSIAAFGMERANGVISKSVTHIKLIHPYSTAFVAFADKLGNSDESELLILSDDIPKCLQGRRGLCYMHFSHAARIQTRGLVAEKYRTTFRGRLAWNVHKALFPRFFLNKTVPSSWTILANSTVTKWYTEKLLNLKSGRVRILHPPVAARLIADLNKKSQIGKEDQMVCLGKFEPNKGHRDLLEAAAILKRRRKFKLLLVGFSGEQDRTLELARQLSLSDEVQIMMNVDRRTILECLIRSKAIIHAAPIEPFGIAVLEGMAAGCIPIVKKGLNGPWLDIICKGRFGFGYDTVEELASYMQMVLDSYWTIGSAKATSRALEFDEAIFRKEFLEICRAKLGSDEEPPA